MRGYRQMIFEIVPVKGFKVIDPITLKQLKSKKSVLQLSDYWKDLEKDGYVKIKEIKKKGRKNGN